MLKFSDNHFIFERAKRFKKLRPHSSDIILLTGGIATGKTFILNLFRLHGFAIFNTDHAVRDLLENDHRIIALILQLFPEASASSLNAIDKQKLASIIFSDSNAKLELEDILYPAIRELRMNFIKKIRSLGEKSIVVEIPLLFEKITTRPEQFLPLFEYMDSCPVISTIATPEIQRMRAMQRKNMTKEKFHDILNAQLSDDYYRLQHSDYLVNTASGKLSTKRAVRKIIYSE